MADDFNISTGRCARCKAVVIEYEEQLYLSPMLKRKDKNSGENIISGFIAIYCEDCADADETLIHIRE